MSQRPAIRVRVHGDIIEYLESNRSPACLTQVRREAEAAVEAAIRRGDDEEHARTAERAVWERALGEALEREAQLVEERDRLRERNNFHCDQWMFTGRERDYLHGAVIRLMERAPASDNEEAWRVFGRPLPEMHERIQRVLRGEPGAAP